jgi:deazaflavin-dependent oxidoreductase (nitroreductase family)
MTAVSDWNAKVVADFRENEGRVGGNFEGAPITILHHVGRKSGKEYLAPVMYLPADDDPDTIYVFASAGGAPVDPDWYANLTAAGNATVEVGTESYPVTVTDLTGAERDRIYAEQVKRYPGFGEYERKNVGIRTIPVLALRRAA